MMLTRVELSRNSIIRLSASVANSDSSQRDGQLWTTHGCDSRAEKAPCCPTSLLRPFIHELLPAVRQQVMLWPISLQLAVGLAWENHHTVVLWLKMPCFQSQYHHLRASSPCLQTHLSFFLKKKIRKHLVASCFFDLHAGGLQRHLLWYGSLMWKSLYVTTYSFTPSLHSRQWGLWLF